MRRVPSVIVAAILLVACAGPDAAHYSAILDQAVVPDGWTEAATVIHGPGGDVECQPTPISECPYAVRFYTTPAGAIEAYASARSMVAEAGFAMEREFDVACDGQSPACALTAIRDADRLSVSVFQPGQDDGTGVAQPDHVTVRLVAGDK